MRSELEYHPLFGLADGMPIGYTVASAKTGPDERHTIAPEDLDLVAAGLSRSPAELGASWVFLEVSASVATRPRVRSLFPAGLRVVLSVDASARELDDPQVVRKLATARGNGRLPLALSGVGGPATGLLSLVDVRPEFIGLDRRLTDEIVKDRVRQALVGAVAYFAAEIGALLIADDVGTEVQRRTLARLGVAAGRGAAFGR